MPACGNNCPDCSGAYGCVIRKCVSRNGVPTCAHCSMFPCDEIAPEDWPGKEYEPGWIACPDGRFQRLTALRETLQASEIIEAKPLARQHKDVVPMPEDMGDLGLALAPVHAYLSAVAAALPAVSYARQRRIQEARYHMVSYLWQFGRGGELRLSPDPHMWMEKHQWKKRKVAIPDPHWAMAIARCHMPGVEAGVLLKKTTSPKNWEVTLRMAGPRNGLAALEALQRYTQALCDAYGEPAWAGAARYRGEAYERFAQADTAVLAVLRSER